jgi:hypothetical protein
MLTSQGACGLVEHVAESFGFLADVSLSDSLSNDPGCRKLSQTASSYMSCKSSMYLIGMIRSSRRLQQRIKSVAGLCAPPPF